MQIKILISWKSSLNFHFFKKPFNKCYGLTCVLPPTPRNVEVLTLGTHEFNLIWKHGLCRRN